MSNPVRVVRALTSFSCPQRGQVTQGHLYRSDDPRVVGRETLFRDVYEEFGLTEVATRNPGEKRQKVRPTEDKTEDKTEDGED